MSYSLSLDRFAGKVAVVTGASSGIGKSISEGLVKYGLVVVGVARRVDRITEHAKQLSQAKGKLYGFKCDLTNEKEILSTFRRITEEVGPIHVLVNNAGIRLGGTLIDGDIEKWKIMLNTNVLGLAIATREALKIMKAQNIKGHIINVNSVAGHRVMDFPRASLYPATKYAVTALTETIRLEINREKLPIKITSLSPGVVLTEFREIADGKEAAEASLKSPALVADDVADAAFYILSTPEHVNIKELIVSVQGQYA